MIELVGLSVPRERRIADARALTDLLNALPALGGCSQARFGIAKTNSVERAHDRGERCQQQEKECALEGELEAFGPDIHVRHRLAEPADPVDQGKHGPECQEADIKRAEQAPDKRRIDANGQHRENGKRGERSGKTVVGNPVPLKSPAISIHEIKKPRRGYRDGKGCQT